MAGQVKNQSDLAALLGVSQPRISQLIRSADWPDGVRHRGPWPMEEAQQIVQWHDAKAGSSPEQVSDLAKVKTQVEILWKREKIEREKLERAIREGKYVEREKYDGSLGGLAALFIAELDEFELTAPGRFANKPAGQIMLEVQGLLDNMRKRLADHAEIELRTVAEVRGDVRTRAERRSA